MSKNEAEETIEKVTDKKGILDGLEEFISGKGNGNNVKELNFNQNKYDALFSYLYSNGQYVFTDSKYDEWMGYGGEHANRAKGRKELKEYIINHNGNYDPSKITELFVNSKGANISYDYKERREKEAGVFNKE